MTTDRSMDLGGFVPPNLDTPAGKTIYGEVGSSGLRKFGYQIDEEFDPNLKGLRGVRKYDEMRKNDPDVGAILTAIEMSIRSVDWNVTAGGDQQVDKDAAEFLQSCMDDMSHSWEDFITEVLTMLAFGWAYMEKVYKLRDGKKNDAPSKYDDGKIGWRKVVLRGQESLKGWVIDQNGGIKGMLQWALVAPTERFIPIEKAVLFRTKREKNNPEGYSLLRNAYRSWYIKTNVEEIEVISAERDMTGVPVITLPVNASQNDKDMALDVLRKLKSDEQTGIVLPRTGQEEHMWWKFEIAHGSGAPKVDTDKTITRSATNIARSVLAQFLTVGQGRIGSYALVKDFRDLFHLGLVGHLDNIAETINRFMVEPLFELNDFPGLEKLPTITHGRMGQRDLDKFVFFLEKAAGLGMPLTDDDFDFMRGEAEMPPLPDGFWEDKHKQEEEEQKKQEALLAEQMKAQQQAPGAGNQQGPGKVGPANVGPKPTSMNPQMEGQVTQGNPGQKEAAAKASEDVDDTEYITARATEARRWFDWLWPFKQQPED